MFINLYDYQYIISVIIVIFIAYIIYYNVKRNQIIVNFQHNTHNSHNTHNLYNSFIGISVNKKSVYLEQVMCDKLISLIMFIKNNNDTFVVMIADEIEKFNIQAYNRRSAKASRRIAHELGNHFYELFQNSIDNHGDDTIELIKMSEMNMPDLTEELMLDDTLDERITSVAKLFMEYRCRHVNTVSKRYDLKLDLTKRYIYAELPSVVCGIKHKDRHYRTIYYSGNMDQLKIFASSTNSLYKLVVDIITCDEFENVRNIIMRGMNIDHVSIPGFVGIDTGELRRS